MTREVPNGVGVSLRRPHMDQVARGEAGDRAAFFEITVENYMHRGGWFLDVLEKVSDRYPVTTHGVMLNLGGTDAPDQVYETELRRFFQRWGQPWHSEHCSFCTVEGNRLHELFPVPQTRQWAHHTADRMKAAQDRLGVPLIMENTCGYTEMGESELRETEFLNEVLQRSGGGLLLDVNNIYVNATNFGFDPKAWLDAIDLGPVKEVHIGGHQLGPEELIIDSHGAAVIDDVYELLGIALERIGPIPVLLERDSHQPTLEQLLLEAERVREVYDAAMKRHAQGGSHG